MRIDLSPQGHIVGTRRVPASGQLTGLKDYAGKELLLLLPKGRPVLRTTLRDHVYDWERVAQKNAKRAAKEWRALQKRLPHSSREALDLARRELRWQRVSSRIQWPETRKTLRRQVRRARTQVRDARVWVRARLERAGVTAPPGSAL